MRAHFVALVALPFVARLAVAQGLDRGRAGVVAPPREKSALARSHPASATDVEDSGRARAFAPIASLIVPGSGQALLRQDRFLAYMAVEVLAWWKYAKDVRDRSAQEAAYKDLAFNVARAPFASLVSGRLPDGDWLYYEWMRDKIASGVYSKSATGPVDPETDTSTYNGAKWELARTTNPTTQAALAQYQREAIKPEYRWSWTGAQLRWDIYGRTTDKRNDAAHAAVEDLIVVGANHVLSMIDAFAMIRLQVRPDQRGGTSLGASVRW